MAGSSYSHTGKGTGKNKIFMEATSSGQKIHKMARAVRSTLAPMQWTGFNSGHRARFNRLQTRVFDLLSMQNSLSRQSWPLIHSSQNYATTNYTPTRVIWPRRGSITGISSSPKWDLPNTTTLQSLCNTVLTSTT